MDQKASRSWKSPFGRVHGTKGRDSPLRRGIEYSINSTDFQESPEPSSVASPSGSSSSFSQSRSLKLSSITSPASTTSTHIEAFRVFAATWNVGGKTPDMELNLDDLLPSDDQSDIYVLGFQEIVPLNAGNVLVNEDSAPAARWLALIDRVLNRASSSSSLAPATATRSFLRRRRPPPSSSSSCLAISCGRRRRAAYASSSSDEDNYAVQPLPLPLPPLPPSSPPPARKRAGGGYVMVASEQMVGLFATVWARRPLAAHLGHVRVSRVGLGLMGRLGNKGCISVSLALHQTSLCFLCSHLASGERPADELRRNADVVQILTQTRFRSLPRRRLLPRRILDHERVIWLGDLNYRIGMEYGEVRRLVDRGEWGTLLEKDQLRAEIGGGVLAGWSEGEIAFPPTYKYSSNSNCYAGDGEDDDECAATSKKRRTPAWCDRILWCGEGIVQREYGRGESRFSDHRPVCAAFLVDAAVRDDDERAMACRMASMKVGVDELLLLSGES